MSALSAPSTVPSLSLPSLPVEFNDDDLFAIDETKVQPTRKRFANKSVDELGNEPVDDNNDPLGKSLQSCSKQHKPNSDTKSDHKSTSNMLGRSDLWLIEICNAHPLIVFLDIIRSSLTHIDIQVVNTDQFSGIQVECMDDSHSVAVQCRIGAKVYFADESVHKISFRVNIKLLFNLLKTMGSNANIYILQKATSNKISMISRSQGNANVVHNVRIDTIDDDDDHDQSTAIAGMFQNSVADITTSFSLNAFKKFITMASSLCSKEFSIEVMSKQADRHSMEACFRLTAEGDGATIDELYISKMAVSDVNEVRELKISNNPINLDDDSEDEFNNNVTSYADTVMQNMKMIFAYRYGVELFKAFLTKMESSEIEFGLLTNNGILVLNHSLGDGNFVKILTSSVEKEDQ